MPWMRLQVLQLGLHAGTYIYLNCIDREAESVVASTKT